MFGNSYRPLPQREAAAPAPAPRSPGLFSSHGGFTSGGLHQGLPYGYIPNVSDNDFSDSSQSWLSWLCSLVVIFLLHLCTFITFPISGWFVLKTVPNYQRVVVFRLGRVCPPKGPGIVLVLPLIDQWQRVDLRTRAFNIPPCQVTTGDGGMLAVGADIQFRIWNPVLSVVSVQDLNASTRMTAQNALTHSLARKSLQEIQAHRLKLGEYLVVDINELTRPWGLEVDRVELTLGALLRPPEGARPQSLVAPPTAAPSVPGIEGLAGPIQQLAMHFLGQGGGLQPQQAEDLVTFTDELSGGPPAAAPAPDAVEELLSSVQLLLSEDLVNRVGASFQFNISSDDGQHRTYYLDLSQGNGAAGAGTLCGEPSVTLGMSDRDLLAVFQGRLQPYVAYVSGQLQIQGDLKTAMKLQEVVKLLK